MIIAIVPLPAMQQFLDNGVLAWGLAACGLAQLSKLFVELLVHRRWRPGVLFETGGMPSSHSALVSGIAAGVGWQSGFDQPGFAVAATVAVSSGSGSSCRSCPSVERWSESSSSSALWRSMAIGEAGRGTCR